ncbi:hypothetical protein K3552_15880 [Leisingera aquaemixtae]|uniref:hypothetical protein n=1 Tax=Leisingera aquaemixtae TaxID=1396826 RepID=UPI0021A6FC47|nr:hypothetical protein [Leisingera aquaemixtae]UWQ36931.1 hypothetical protein K3552_15880 [Leisingera aquaemixtae]
MSELQIEMRNFEFDWLHVIEEILSVPSTGTAEANIPDSDPQDADETLMYDMVPDLSFYPSDGSGRTAVSLKLYRWPSISHENISNSVRHLSHILDTGGYKKGIVIFTVPMPMKLKFFEAENVSIWDLVRLREVASKDEALLEKLDDLISQTTVDGQPFLIPYPSEDELAPRARHVGKGTKLAEDIRRTAGGPDGWREYEELCEKAVKLLFKSKIAGWKTQNSTIDGLNRMDMIGRITQGIHSFWSMIQTDFQTRYVVFEAKNSNKPISQEQVWTTEKYLFTKGLRSVAVILARSEISNGARKAAEGVLRENGKLILFLTSEDLCSMLEELDRGDDPDNLLFSKMDKMLMEMGR